MNLINVERHDAQKMKILVSARHLFAEKGYQETSVKDIAIACGFTKSSLYHYFVGKNEILNAMLDPRFMEPKNHRVNAWSASNIKDAFDLLAKEFFDLMDRVEIYELLLILMSEGAKRREVGNFFHQIEQRYLEDFLEGTVGHGLIRPNEEEEFKTALYAFWGSLFHFTLDRFFQGKPMVRFQREKYGNYLAAVMASGWKTPNTLIQSRPLGVH